MCLLAGRFLIISGGDSATEPEQTVWPGRVCHVNKVRLFWWLVLIFGLSFAVAVLSWAAGELANGADFTFDNLLDSTLVVSTATTLLSAVLLIFIGPAVFHERYEQTRVPRN